MEVTAHAIACTLTALYLNGGPNADRPPRRRWRWIDRALRQASVDLVSAQSLLSKEGFWLEAAILGRAGILDQAEKLVLGGRVLAATDDTYPARWLAALGDSSPPVLWRTGEIPPGPFLAIVGSRTTEPAVLAFACACAEEAIKRGFSVISGAAAGCDRSAAAGARKASKAAGVPIRLCEILPFGLKHARPSAGCLLSVNAPADIFSTAGAMERNGLIYAAADRAVVAGARFKEGGAWHGAVDCQRRKLSQVVVRNSDSASARALIGLGAISADSPEEVFELQIPGRDASLLSS